MGDIALVLACGRGQEESKKGFQHFYKNLVSFIKLVFKFIKGLWRFIMEVFNSKKKLYKFVLQLILYVHKFSTCK